MPEESQHHPKETLISVDPEKPGIGSTQESYQEEKGGKQPFPPAR
jgi:hypothetical protein